MFLSRLFGPKSKEETVAGTGPLALAPGDSVEYYQRTFTVAGMILIDLEDRRRTQYHLRDPEGRPAVVVADRAPQLELAFEEPTAEEPTPGEEDDAVRHGELRFSPLRRAVGTVRGRRGKLPAREADRVEILEYENAEEVSRLVVETWGSFRVVRRGAPVYEGELTLHRAGEDRYEARPPPTLDRRAAIESHRAAADEGPDGDQPSMS